MSYDIKPELRKVVALGRAMMDLAITEKDDELANRLAVIGSRLVTVGTPYGPKADEFTAEDLALINRMAVACGN